MRALTVTAVVRPDHLLTVQVPEDIPPGVRTAVIVLEDANQTNPRPISLTFHPHPVGPVDPACTYRREDLYGDDGR
jgi:hypothetical protein